MAIDSFRTLSDFPSLPNLSVSAAELLLRKTASFLEFTAGRFHVACAFFQASFNISSQMFEPHYNYALLADKMGDLQTSYNAIRRSLEVFDKHSDSKSLMKALQQHFTII